MLELSIQFLRKRNDGFLDYYIVHDYTLDTIPQDGDYVISKTDNVLVKDNNNLPVTIFPFQIMKAKQLIIKIERSTYLGTPTFRWTHRAPTVMAV